MTKSPGVVTCGCGRKLDPSVDKTTLRPGPDVPDEHIDWLPAPEHLKLICPNCPRWTIFAPSADLEVMKRARSKARADDGGAR